MGSGVTETVAHPESNVASTTKTRMENPAPDLIEIEE
jgi:hypothetical protein